MMNLQNFDLKVPYGLEKETGKKVAPWEAERQTFYLCPDCKQEIFIRVPTIKRTHFAHRPVKSGHTCRLEHGESREHRSAKYAILLAVSHFIEKKSSLKLHRKCVCKTVYLQNLPDVIKEAKLEYRIHMKDDQYIIADVALLNEKGGVCCIIEVLETHSVDYRKEKKLKGVPWIEVSARKILDNPYQWHVVKSGNLNPIECQRCKELEKKKKIQEQELKDWREKVRLSRLDRYYPSLSDDEKIRRKQQQIRDRNEYDHEKAKVYNTTPRPVDTGYVYNCPLHQNLPLEECRLCDHYHHLTIVLNHWGYGNVQCKYK